MRFAYADPPYPGKAKKHYGSDAREVHHGLLVAHLNGDFDAWALSTNGTTLRYVLQFCPDDVRIGDVVDFWRVEVVEPGRLLRLRTEMKVPGRAWLQLEAQPVDGDMSRLVQTAFFAPKGLSGLLYWYGLYPIHGLIFSGMIRSLARLAEKADVRTPDKEGVMA